MLRCVSVVSGSRKGARVSSPRGAAARPATTANTALLSDLAYTAIRDKLVIAKQASDLHTSSFDQLLLDRYLRDFDNARHVATIRAAYGERYAAMDAALARHMPDGFSWTRPEGGMFLWVSGPRALDTTPLLAASIARGVAFVPGADFFPDSQGGNHMRLNFSNAQPDDIRRGIARLAELCRTAANG